MRGEITQFAFRAGRPFAQHHGGGHFLTKLRMRHRESQRLRNCRMRGKYAIHFQRAHFLTTAIDQFLQAAREGQKAFRIKGALITGAEPAMREGLGIGFWIGFIARGHIGAADHHFANLALRQDGAIIIHDRHFRPGSLADRARLARPGQRVGCHLVRGFGHAVAFHQRAAEYGFQLLHHRPGERCRRRTNEAELRARNDLRIAVRARQDSLVHGGHGGVPAWPFLIQQTEETQSIKARRANHRAAGAEGRKHRRDQPMNVKQRHDVKAGIGG